MWCFILIDIDINFGEIPGEEISSSRGKSQGTPLYDTLPQISTILRSSSHSTADTMSSLIMNGLSTSTEELSSNDESESRDELSIEEEEGVVRRGMTTRSRSQQKKRYDDQEGGGAAGRVASKRLNRLS